MLPFLENTWSIVDFGSKLYSFYLYACNSVCSMFYTYMFERRTLYIACVVYKLCVVWIYKFQIREKMSMKCVLVSVSCPGHLKSINLIANNITNTCAFDNVRSHKSGAVIYSAQPLLHCFPSFCEILALEWEVSPTLCCRRPHLWHTVVKYFVCITFSNIRFLEVSLAVIA